jgi:hypothetical protein
MTPDIFKGVVVKEFGLTYVHIASCIPLRIVTPGKIKLSLFPLVFGMKMILKHDTNKIPKSRGLFRGLHWSNLGTGKGKEFKVCYSYRYEIYSIRYSKIAVWAISPNTLYLIPNTYSSYPNAGLNHFSTSSTAFACAYNLLPGPSDLAHAKSIGFMDGKYQPQTDMAGYSQ